MKEYRGFMILNMGMNYYTIFRKDKTGKDKTFCSARSIEDACKKIDIYYLDYTNYPYDEIK